MHTVYPRPPKYLGVMANNKRKSFSKDQMPPLLLPPRRLNSVASAREVFFKPPITECTCPLESYTGAEV